ncbi:DNA repair protein RecN (Recombination protein N) [Pustulibacterium marinum]|uniref:DNA repair protein RecN n=1 Tax=Pustulibacterium marinum TaxID=1224947 RepID=A0A1I7IKM0_9FLAO|nr:DNA repair protein RecN [Pustulibacterium marinum]SFU73481.1 DNA repair protein RecN (Recombination protein N) [Pustulibacterium marinum]
MLASLFIKNYALIDELKVRFSNGYTIITGETGAGKSILLGGLSLVLGKRADLSLLKNKEEKCVIESEFGIAAYNLKEFFEEEDLDYEDQTFIRREILPSGKSRAFINDTPVTLDVLNRLGGRLIDIHSQHQTLELTEEEFQYHVIDAVAGNFSLIKEYQTVLSSYTAEKKALNKLLKDQEEASKEYEYNSFLVKELEALKLDTLDKEDLESSYEQLSNVEEIKEKLSHALQLINTDEVGVQTSVTELKNIFAKMQGYGAAYQSLHERIQSVLIEIDDINTEVLGLEEGLETDPSELDRLQETLQKIYALEKKHMVSGIAELLEIQHKLQEKVSITENADEAILEKQKAIEKIAVGLNKLATQIHKQRAKVIPSLKKDLEKIISELGMPNARFQISVTHEDKFLPNGKDVLTFEFSANKGTDFGLLKKVASGGELSRIMLAIKSILSNYMKLPTIMFDEIDTGVSGEIAIKMADIMKDMSKYMQVFCITHLPQVAAKGDQHLKVYKESTLLGTSSNLKQLNPQERVTEIAQMLGGENVSSSALSHAKELLS